MAEAGGDTVDDGALVDESINGGAGATDRGECDGVKEDGTAVGNRHYIINIQPIPGN
jgi:hypothetical protein